MNANDAQAMAEGNTFTTEPIYTPTTYYYSGRIESDGFDSAIVVGTGTIRSNVMFNLSKAYSYAKILYNQNDLGDAEGRIDSIYFWVDTAAYGDLSIPVKFWLKDTTDVYNMGTSNENINWSNETANAKLVYDGEFSFNNAGWVGFALDGGYDYNGKGLLLFAEQDCGGVCLPPYGLTPMVYFSNTTTAGKVYNYVSNDDVPLIGAAQFTIRSYRINTKFKMNYTCESPKSAITINTTVPQHDVGVVAISAPVTQNNSFTGSENVTVTLRNFGTQAVSNFPVSYRLDDGTPVTQNYSGSLAAGATTTMTFNTACDLTSVYFSTPFRAYTGLGSDAYHPNDTTTILLSMEDPCMSRPKSIGSGAHITNVSIAMLDNGTGAPFTGHSVLPGNGMYTDYTQTLAPELLILGQNYPISVTHAFSNRWPREVYKHVYIDFNRNGEFEEDELVLSASDIPAEVEYATTTGVVVIPSDADLGLTRMRVICSTVPLDSRNSPCGFYDGQGETEDYAIMLSNPLPVDLGVAAILHPVGEVCADSNANLRITIRNYGTETQTLSADNALNITATVTGAVPGIYNKVVTNGVLPPNSDMMVTIPNVNLSAQGTYHVHALLTYEGDQYQGNDTRSIDAKVATHPLELPYVDPLNASNADLENPGMAIGWTITGSSINYCWEEYVGASQYHALGGGPAHDHTFAGSSYENLGGYVSVPGRNNYSGVGIYNQFTSLNSRCINMHYKKGYPSELNFYKYFADMYNADFEMRVEAGSGEYYQTIAELTKADGGQVGGDDEWSAHFIVLDSVDEVAKLRFTVTHQFGRIDPSIDDINITFGGPDMALESIILPTIDSCLEVNTTFRPVVTLRNVGHLAVDAFDVSFKVGADEDIVHVTEHIDHHLEPGESMEYTSTHDFMVNNQFSFLEIMATVIISGDVNENNNSKSSSLCTNVSVEDYETENGVSLGQNEPNPANWNTRIPYSVPEPGEVFFEVTNNVGQVIYNTIQNADVETNYIELNTSGLAPGVYYYTLHYKDVVLTKKMVVKR